MQQALKLTLIGLGLLAGLVVSEVALRFFSITGTPDRVTKYEFDSVLGWRTRREFAFYHSTPEAGHFLYYDRDGLPAPRKRLHSSRLRARNAVALFGDSFAESYSVRYEDSFPAHLERSLGSPVLNFGVSGYAPDQYLLQARRVLPGLAALRAIVVTFFPFNDTEDIYRRNYQGYSKPHFPTPSSKPDNLPLKERRPPTLYRNFLHRFLTHSAIYTLARPRIRLLLDPIPPRAEYLSCFTEAAMSDSLDFLARIHALAPHTPFYVLYIPVRAALLAPSCHQENERLFLRECQKRALRCIPFSTLLTEGTDPAKMFYPIDEHFTPYGGKIVGRYLARYISQTEGGETKLLHQAGGEAYRK